LPEWAYFKGFPTFEMSAAPR